jgi:hypothetical protein
MEREKVNQAEGSECETEEQTVETNQRMKIDKDLGTEYRS